MPKVVHFTKLSLAQRKRYGGFSVALMEHLDGFYIQEKSIYIYIYTVLEVLSFNKKNSFAIFLVGFDEF